MTQQTTHLPTKNVVFSKKGATFTCPVCEKQATYQIGKFDREAWGKRVNGKWYCIEHVELPKSVPLGSFPSLQPADTKSDLDTLMDMV